MTKIKGVFEKYLEWKLYKVLYIGILVPLFFEESMKWIKRYPFISFIFFITAIILLLPVFSKIVNLIGHITPNNEDSE